MLKPLVVSWGYESETPSGSQFVDHNEWWGTRDLAAFLSVPAAIEFQEKQDWAAVREECHQMACYAQEQICNLTEIRPLHPADDWFRQMTTAPLPPDTDIAALKTQFYDQYKIEVPLVAWNGNKLIRISVQGYNTRKDILVLLSALKKLMSLRGRVVSI